MGTARPVMPTTTLAVPQAGEGIDVDVGPLPPVCNGWVAGRYAERWVVIIDEQIPISRRQYALLDALAWLPEEATNRVGTLSPSTLE